MLIRLLALLTAVIFSSANVVSQGGKTKATSERELERERDARDQFRQLDADLQIRQQQMEALSRTSRTDATAEKQQQFRHKQFIEFVKSADEFFTIALEVMLLAPNNLPEKGSIRTINKKAGALEDVSGKMLAFLLLDTDQKFSLPNVNYSGMTFQDRMAALPPLVQSLSVKLRQIVVAEREKTIAANVFSEAAHDLQSARLLASALKKP